VALCGLWLFFQQAFVGKAEVAVVAYNDMVNSLMSSNLAPSLSLDVRISSALLGLRLPEGWLWQR